MVAYAGADMISLLLAAIWGVGIPLQYTPADEYPLADSSVWLNWFHSACDQPDYWPMIYSPRDMARYPLPEDCAGKPLLIGNECEVDSQCRATPAETAAMLYAHRDHTGPLYCCGSLSNDAGLWHTLATLGSYYTEYGETPPLTGLHLHVYDLGNLARWRALADMFGWEIVVSEYACLGSDPDTIATCLPWMSQRIQAELAPVAMFWFSWHWPDYPFAAASLVDSEGAYTAVGDAWRLEAGIAATEYIVFVPGVSGAK